MKARLFDGLECEATSVRVEVRRATADAAMRDATMIAEEGSLYFRFMSRCYREERYPTDGYPFVVYVQFEGTTPPVMDTANVGAQVRRRQAT